MHLLLARIRYFIAMTLLFVVSSTIIAEETGTDIVLLLDKSIDFKSHKNEITAIFEQLDTAESKTRIAVIGFDSVVTDIASLSLASEGSSKVLIEALTNEKHISSSTNVAAGIERGISELTSQDAVAASKAIIVFSDGNIQTGSEASNQDYRSWLEDVLTQSAIRSKIRIFWVFTENSTLEDFTRKVGKVAQLTGGNHYLINHAAEGGLAKDVLTTVTQRPEEQAIEPIAEETVDENLSASDHSKLSGDALEPAPSVPDVETTTENQSHEFTSTELKDRSKMVLDDISEELRKKTSSIKTASEPLIRNVRLFSLSLKERFADAVNVSKNFLSTQTDKQTWLLALLGLLVSLIVGILGIRLSTHKNVERVEPVITDRANLSARTTAAHTEELFVNGVMQKAKSAQKGPASTHSSTENEPKAKAFVQEEKEVKSTQPLMEGVKARNHSVSNDRTAIRPTHK